MSATVGELAIAIIIALLCFRMGLELAPIVIDWWRDIKNVVNDEERIDDDNR